jgi:hypothetical protein
MEREHQQQPIRRRPFPRLYERGDLRADVGVCRHCAFRPSGGAARVDDHGATGRAKERQIDPRPRRQRIGRRHEPRTGELCERPQHGRGGIVGNDDGRRRIGNDVGQFSRRV